MVSCLLSILVCESNDTSLQSTCAPERFTSSAHLPSSAWLKGASLVGAHRPLLDALLAQPRHRLGLRRAPCAPRRAQLRQRGRRRGGRRVEHEPRDEVEVGDALLHQRRHVGRGGAAHRAARAQRAQLAGLDLRHHRGRVIEHEVDLARHHARQRHRAFLVRHVDHLAAQALRQQLAGQVARGAVAGRGEGHALGRAAAIAARSFSDLTGEFGGDDQQRRRVADEGDRREVAHRVVGQLAEQRGVDRVRADGAHHQRPAVGRAPWRPGRCRSSRPRRRGCRRRRSAAASCPAPRRRRGRPCRWSCRRRTARPS